MSNDDDNIRLIINDEKKLNPILRKFFDEYDTDGSGSIDKSELKNVFKNLNNELGEPMNDEVLNETFKIFDSNKSGKIEFKEFKKVMIETIKESLNNK